MPVLIRARLISTAQVEVPSHSSGESEISSPADILFYCNGFPHLRQNLARGAFIVLQ